MIPNICLWEKEVNFFGLDDKYKSVLKVVRAKNFYNADFFILWLQSDDELPTSEMDKNWGVTDFVSEIKRVKNYPNFDKSALVTRHGLSAC